MNRFAVYLVPDFLLDRAGDPGDPGAMLSLLDATSVPPVFVWTSEHDVLDGLLDAWTWSASGGTPVERVFVMRPEGVDQADSEALDDRAFALAAEHDVDVVELEEALDVDTVTEHAENVLGALVIGVHTLRNAARTALENEAAIVVVRQQVPRPA